MPDGYIPQQFQPNVPYTSPVTDEEHRANWVEMERWMREFPYPIIGDNNDELHLSSSVDNEESLISEEFLTLRPGAYRIMVVATGSVSGSTDGTFRFGINATDAADGTYPDTFIVEPIVVGEIVAADPNIVPVAVTRVFNLSSTGLSSLLKIKAFISKDTNNSDQYTITDINLSFIIISVDSVD